MKVYLETLGCRLNESEIDAMGRAFRQVGHEITQEPQEAGICVINTCAVTQEAGRKSRQLIHQAHRAAPQAQIIVTGCYSEIEKAKVSAIPGVTQVVSNLDKDKLVSLVMGIAPEVFDEEPLAREEAMPAPNDPSARRTRAFVKIQDGCNNRCAFCVTTIARGDERSRPMAEILSEIRGFLKLGYQEIVLTGVHLGAYGRDWRDQSIDLKDLLQAILDHTAAPRIRLSSLEPWDLPDDFFSLWRDARMCRYLHLPLQAGCDQTLRRMVRRTRKDPFRQLIAEARSTIPDVAICSDMIVGFPGETEAEFNETVEFLHEIDFCHMHVFRYSPRPGTRAAEMPDQIPNDEKARRSQILQDISREGRRRFNASQLGHIANVLWEQNLEQTPQGYRWQGLTDHYIRTQIILPRDLHNRILPIRLDTQAAEDIVLGSLL
jgi:threonylcarbamoyladenosine tRNA methylthiotransferase MtaB